MIKAIQFIGILCLFCSPAIQAGTVIVLSNKNALSTVITDGQRARINMGASEYVIVDYKNRKLKVVDQQKQQVMLFNTELAAAANAPAVRTSVTSLGAGQLVAGYKTERFNYLADGKSCGVIYGSKDAYQVSGIKELLTAIKTMLDQQRAVLGGFASLLDACTLAELQLSDHVKTIGVPMRTEKNGSIENEIRSIKTGVTLPADTFNIPASYKTVSMQDKIKSVSKDMLKLQQPMQQQVQQYQPQMQQMMRQMQQPGQMSPQAMEQMHRTQEMMRQYQQPRY